MDDPIRITLIREAMRRGALPQAVPGHLYAGRGSGASCAVCAQVIGHESTEYEFDFEARKVKMHLRCFAAWANEVEKRRSASDIVPEPRSDA